MQKTSYDISAAIRLHVIFSGLRQAVKRGAFERMPYSLVLHCVSPSGTVYPEDLHGQKTLALFLEELIQKQDAALAAQLHAPRNAKPFTTAILHQTRTDRETRARAATDRPGAGQAMLPAGEMQLRITLLDDALYPC